MNLNTALKKTDSGMYAAVRDVQDVGTAFSVGEVVEVRHPWLKDWRWVPAVVTQVNGDRMRVKWRNKTGDWARETWVQHRSDDLNTIRKVAA